MAGCALLALVATVVTAPSAAQADTSTAGTSAEVLSGSLDRTFFGGKGYRILTPPPWARLTGSWPYQDVQRSRLVMTESGRMRTFESYVDRRLESEIASQYVVRGWNVGGGIDGSFWGGGAKPIGLALGDEGYTLDDVSASDSGIAWGAGQWSGGNYSAAIWRTDGAGRSAGRRAQPQFHELDSDGTTRTCFAVDPEDGGSGPSRVWTQGFGVLSISGPELAAPGCRSMERSPRGTSYYAHRSEHGEGSPVLTLRRALSDTTLDPMWAGESVATAPAVLGVSVAEVGDVVYLVGNEWTSDGGGVPVGVFVARYRGDGSLDGTFGREGVVRLGPGRDALTGLVRTTVGFVADEDGVVLALNATPAVDATRHPSSSIIAKLRASDGALDPAFAGGRGWVASSKPTLDILPGAGGTVVTLSGGFRFRSPTSRTYDYLPLTLARRHG